MNEKDKAIAQAMASIQNRLRHVYNQGFENGRKAERKTGKWIDNVLFSECSICGKSVVQSRINYCPFCGSKMEVDE